MPTVPNVCDGSAWCSRLGTSDPGLPHFSDRYLLCDSHTAKIVPSTASHEVFTLTAAAGWPVNCCPLFLSHVRLPFQQPVTLFSPPFARNNRIDLRTRRMAVTASSCGLLSPPPVSFGMQDETFLSKPRNSMSLPWESGRDLHPVSVKPLAMRGLYIVFSVLTELSCQTTNARATR